MSYSSVQALLSRGISRPTLYEVIVPLGIGGGAAVEQLRFLCNRTAVPEATASTIAVNGHEAMGVTREQPTFIQFSSPFSITVIADRDYTVYKAMRRWFETIGRNVNPGAIGGFAGSSQKIAYYDTFKRNIILRKLELQSGRGSQEAPGYMEPFTIEFNNAFPIRMGEISLSSEEQDGRVEFTIDFAYETYTFRGDPLSSVGSAVGAVINAVAGLL
jgi:hypothetical protein